MNKKFRIEGSYIRVSAGDSAEIQITPLLAWAHRFHVSGIALWGEGREFGPNIGTLDFSAEAEGNLIHHQSEMSTLKQDIMLSFTEDAMIIVDNTSLGWYGMNVSFDGTYKRVTLSDRFLIKTYRRLRMMVRMWLRR